MAEKLIWNTTVRAEGGPQLTGSGVLTVAAYDKLSVVVPRGSDLDVDLGPGAAGKIICLVIKPAAPNKELTYEVGGNPIKLDQPQFLIGGGVDLAGNPAKITITNGTAKAAAVEILVGRDEAPQP
jgi:hypothetical protein